MISNTEDVLVFFLFILIAAVTGTLTTKIRGRETLLRKREENALALYNLSNDLSNALNLKEVEIAFIDNVKKVFNAEALLLLPDEKGKLIERGGLVVEHRFVFADKLNGVDTAVLAFFHDIGTRQGGGVAEPGGILLQLF